MGMNLKYPAVLVATMLTLFPRAYGESISISDKGVGPISEKTPFNRAIVKKLLPTYTVRKITSYTEGEPFPIIEVSQKITLFVINPKDDGKSIFSIQVLDKSIGTGHPWHVGTLHSEIYKNRTDKSCTPMEEEMSGNVLCTAPGLNNVFLVFEGSWDGPDGEIPPINVLKKYVVSQVVWRPGSH